jgi:hypothetical protein
MLHEHILNLSLKKAYKLLGELDNWSFPISSLRTPFECNKLRLIKINYEHT